MIHLSALELLRQHAPLPFGWDEVVVGYDFGILSIREIQDWLRTVGPLGLEGQRTANLEGPELLSFEASLWAACSEALGIREPRPGLTRWARAQDLWRTALLKEALAWPLESADFAEAIETIRDRVGCPEDMHGLVKTGCAWAGTVASVERSAVVTFVEKLEHRLLPQDGDWLSLAAS